MRVKFSAYKAVLQNNIFINYNSINVPLFGKDPLLRPEARGLGEIIKRK